VDDPGGFYIIGAWSHAAEFDAEVFNPEDQSVAPSVAAQYARLFDFLAPPLAAPARPNAPPTAGLEYYTMGEKAWKHTAAWPPEGSVSQKWFLTGEKALRTATPAKGDAFDRYDVNFNAGSGSKSRWTTQLGGSDVYYGDRREADALLLTYTSPPLEREIEITGTPLVQLYVGSTHQDGAIIAYLEAVAPSGAVTMITEGELRLIHRRVSPRQPPYEIFGPYHSFERQDAQLMVPGQIAEISFALLPTSIRLPRGYSLRLAIAGHDKDSFFRYPAKGNPTLRIFRNRAHPSSLTLPVIDRAPGKTAMH
jgi:putative CocE/NonD family hydrolase